MSNRTRATVERFVSRLVIAARRERWRWLLLERPERAGTHSHRLLGHLELDLFREVAAPDELSIPASEDGVLIELGFAPEAAVFSDVPDRVWSRDALFIAHSGKAVYFFHEDCAYETW